MPLSVTLPGNVEFATFWVLSVRSTGPIPRRCSSGCIIKGAWAPSCLPVGQVAFHVAVTHGHPHPQAAAFTWRETHVWGSGHLSQLLILFFNPTCKNKVTETSPLPRECWKCHRHRLILTSALSSFPLSCYCARHFYRCALWISDLITYSSIFITLRGLKRSATPVCSIKKTVIQCSVLLSPCNI